MFSPVSLTVVLSDPSKVRALHIRAYDVSMNDPSRDVTVPAPAGGFQTENTVQIGDIGLLDDLVGFHTKISVAEVGDGPPESAQVFTDNPDIMVAVVQPVAAPTSVHANM